MIKKVHVLLFCSLVPIYTQQLINRSEKVTIKRKLSNFSVYGDIDFRTTNDRGLYYRHFETGTIIPIGKTWSASLQYRNIYTKSGEKWKLEKRPRNGPGGGQKNLVQKFLECHKFLR